MWVAVTLAKFVIAIGVVVLLSLITEHVSPRVAGLLSGYPLGAAIALFLIGFEIGADFAAQSAVYALLGLIASQSFVFFYYQVSNRFTGYLVLKSSVAAFLGYGLAAAILHRIELGKSSSVVMAISSMIVFSYLFRHIPNCLIENRIRLTSRSLLLRAVIAASAIWGITALAKVVGPAWSGLFSAFPTTLYPLILIVHLTYGKEQTHTIIKNFPAGVGSLIIYCLTVSVSYIHWGIYWGTVASFMAATGYLLIYGGILYRVNHVSVRNATARCST